MCKQFTRLALTLLFSLILLSFNLPVFAESIKGIYVMQSSLENTNFINYLIRNAKRVGINTFVVDLDIPSRQYRKNIELLKQNNIAYVARIVMFDGGGSHKQITTEDYWKRKYKLVAAAIGYGAEQIQLDYIRYNTRSGSSTEHSKNIYKIVRWYKDQLVSHNIPLQVDVFGISSYGEETHIGQNIPLFAKAVDAICPMVYPSHYTPFSKHVATPYETVYDSLVSIQDQFEGKMPVKLIAYIELSNYHYPLSRAKKLSYIQAQLKAVKDAGADGWYAWSPHNYYDVLFDLLGSDKKS
jgi:hypothetical protein